MSRQDTGSCCEVIFRKQKDVQTAQSKVRSLHKKIQSNLNRVSLDVRKNREGPRPARVVHRAMEVLTEIEGHGHDAKHVFKNIASECISMVNYNAFFTLKGSLKPSVWASMRYSETELAQIWGHANSD